MRANILTDYLGEIGCIRATLAGTGEISYEGALAGALNAAGAVRSGIGFLSDPGLAEVGPPAPSQ